MRREPTIGDRFRSEFVFRWLAILQASKGEAVRLIRSGGIYVNGERLGDEKARLMPADAIQGQYFLIRKGKRDNFLIRLVEEASGQSRA